MSKKSLTSLISLLIVVIAVGFIVVRSKTNKGGVEGFVKIGAVLHLTGDQAEPAQAFSEGIRLATEEINDNGGILNRKVELIIEDDNLKSEQANTAAIKLINIDKISAGINASFLESMANGPTFQQAEVPVITLWDSSQELEKIGRYVFGIGIWSPSAGEKAAEFAYNDLGLRKMAVVNIQNEWSQTVSNIFGGKFKEFGGEITGTYSVNPVDTGDFRTTITKIMDKNPDGMYSPITDGVVIFYKQLKELGFRNPIITSDIITEHHIEVLGHTAEGIYQTQAQDPSGVKTSQMRAGYFKKYGRETKQTIFVAWGYDAVYMIKKAIELGNSFKPESIKDNLYKLKGVGGASGKINIDENGSSRTLESIFQIRGGGFVFVK